MSHQDLRKLPEEPAFLKQPKEGSALSEMFRQR